MILPTLPVTALLRLDLDVFPVMETHRDWGKVDRGACLVCDSGREEILADIREVATLIPSHSTLGINVIPGNIPANTVGEIFRRIREEQLSSEEMRQVVIGGTVEKEEVEGTETVVRWETLVPPDLAPEAAPDPRNGCHPPGHPL